MSTYQSTRMTTEEIRREHLRVLLDTRCGGSQTRLADTLDCSPNYVSRMLSTKKHRKRIGDDMARHIESRFGLDHGFIDVPYRPHSANTEPGPDLVRSVPLISWVRAGQWQGAVDMYQPGVAEDWYQSPVSGSSNMFCLRVRGASMEPRFQEGELIFVDPERSPASGDYVVVRLDDRDEATFKRLRYEGGETWLEAINPDWPHRFIRLTEDATLCGVVVFKGEPL